MVAEILRRAIARCGGPQQVVWAPVCRVHLCRLLALTVSNEEREPLGSPARYSQGVRQCNPVRRGAQTDRMPVVDGVRARWIVMLFCAILAIAGPHNLTRAEEV